MKRKLEFRAWDEKRKTMFLVRTGYLPKGVTRKRDFFIGFNSTGLEVSEYEGKGAWRIFPVMQSTGISDTNGTEIFEDDIINLYCDCDSEFGCSHPPRKYKVVWHEDAMFELVSVDGKPSSFELSSDFEDAYEVIGNVYANPELTAAV